jgi:hypothetical protein
MIAIEDKRVKAKTIPRQKIVSIWKELAKTPLPRVKALQLEDSDFDYAIELTKCRDDERREIEEWGRVLSTKGTDACVYNADDSGNVDYVILVRKNPYHSLGEILEHELSHIAKGDL